MDKKVKKVLNKINNDIQYNKKLIKKTFGDTELKLLYALEFFINKSIPIDKQLLFVDAILSIFKVKQIYIENNIFDSIIQKVLNQNYTEDIVIKFLELCFKYDMYMPSPDLEDISRNLMQTIIVNMGYYNRLVPIYNYLLEEGFDVLTTDSDYKNTLYTLEDFKDDVFPDQREFIELYKKDRSKLIDLSYKEIINKIEYIDGINYDHENKLFEYVRRYYDEEYVLKVIEALLQFGLNPNMINKEGLTFIHVAMKTGHDDKFIYNLLKIAIKYGYDVNYINDDNENLIEYYSNYFTTFTKLTPIYKLLRNNGFTKKNEILILKAIDNIYIDDKDEFLLEYNSYNKSNEDILKDEEKEKDMNYLSKFKYEIKNEEIINLNNYDDIGFDIGKVNIIVGKKGIGKTMFFKSIPSQYTFNNHNLMIITKDNIINNCNTIGEFKSHLLNIIRICSENKIVLIIDDFDDIYNNLNDLERKELSIVIKSYINEYNLSFVGLINSINLDYILNNNILNKYFSIQTLEEPSKSKIKELINYFIENNRKNYYIDFKDDNVYKLFSYLLLDVVNSNNIKDNENISVIYVIKDLIDNIFMSDTTIDYNSIKYTFISNVYLKDDIKEIINKEFDKEILIKKLTK